MLLLVLSSFSHQYFRQLHPRSLNFGSNWLLSTHSLQRFQSIPENYRTQLQIQYLQKLPTKSFIPLLSSIFTSRHQIPRSTSIASSTRHFRCISNSFCSMLKTAAVINDVYRPLLEALAFISTSDFPHREYHSSLMTHDNFSARTDEYMDGNLESLFHTKITNSTILLS